MVLCLVGQLALATAVGTQVTQSQPHTHNQFCWVIETTGLSHHMDTEPPEADRDVAAGKGGARSLHVESVSAMDACESEALTQLTLPILQRLSLEAHHI